MAPSLPTVRGREIPDRVTLSLGRQERHHTQPERYEGWSGQKARPSVHEKENEKGKRTKSHLPPKRNSPHFLA